VEQIVVPEKGDPAVAMSAAYLHDVGSKEAEAKYQSSDIEFLEKEGPQVARDILTRLDGNDNLIDEVCDIVGHRHHPRAEETVNFKIVYDADLLANLEEKQKKVPMAAERLALTIDTEFLTASGRELARSVLLEEKNVMAKTA